MTPQFALRAAALLCCAIALSACRPQYITGKVVNARGETLPGVAVSIVDTDTEILTGILGKYRLRYTPGPIELSFAKSGYSPARLTLEAPAQGGIEAETITLWQLPSSAGIFLYENDRYRELTRDTPESFFAPEGESIVGVRRPARVATPLVDPFIVCYKTPRHDARLSRLAQTEALLNKDSASKIPVWIAAGTMGATLRPIDEPEQLLLRLDLDRPLEPGIYAVHWGAMDGYTTLDERAFLFEISGPPEPVEPIEIVEPVEDEKAAPSPQ